MNEKYQISKMNYHTTSTSSTTSTTRIINLNNNTRHRANNVNTSNNKTQHQTSSFRLNNYFQRFDQSKTNHTITTPFVSSIMAFMMIIFTTNSNYDNKGIMNIGSSTSRNDNTITLCASIDKSHPSPTPVGVGKESNFEDKVDTVDNLHLPVYTR